MGMGRQTLLVNPAGTFRWAFIGKLLLAHRVVQVCGKNISVAAGLLVELFFIALVYLLIQLVWSLFRGC